MAGETMEIDSQYPPATGGSASPEKKRKHKDKEQKSSKKRKHQEDSPAVHAATGSSPIKTKKHKDQHRQQEEGPVSPAPEDDARSKKKQKKQADKKHGSPTPSTTIQSPTAVRKPLLGASTANSAAANVQADSSSPFHLITSTLYLPLSPISISPTHALPSLLAEHLSPLLLTYYPPFRGLILAYSNASISSKPPTPKAAGSGSDANPQPLTLATTAGEYGVLYVYLSATFLVFRPERGQTLEGWINVQSEGFLGAVVFNLFSAGIDRKRLPAGWKWIPPGTINATTSDDDTDANVTATGESASTSEPDSDKENFKPLPTSPFNLPGLIGEAAEADDDDDAAAQTGYFQTPSGRRVRGTIRFRVREVDVIPGAERDKAFLSIEGTMLGPEDEAKLVEEERRRFTGKASSSGGNSSRGGSQDLTMADVDAPASSSQVKTSASRSKGADGEKASKKKKKKGDSR